MSHVTYFLFQAGQERFRSLAQSYYRDADALLLLYDVTSYSSFENIVNWLHEIKRLDTKPITMMLIGNKVDKSQRVVSREIAERLARDFQMIFLETSAKTGQNVELAFMSMAQVLFDQECQTRKLEELMKNTIKISNKDKRTDWSDWCC